MGQVRQPEGFRDKLGRAIASSASLLCVGLDPELDRLPDRIPRTPEGVVQFNRAIVDATSDLVCAYKPNLAFYEAMGPDGLQCLLQTLKAIPSHLPVIADAKRGDVGHSAKGYARALYDVYGFDAVTVSPYLGEDSLLPFLDRADRGVFVLCRTSNPGASELQNLLVSESGTTCPLYEYVAWRVRRWNRHQNCGLVVGATAAEELRRIRLLAPDLPLLIPGVGVQGGDLAAARAAHHPDAPAIINASRSVIFASRGPDFATAARAAAQRLRDELAVSGRA